VTNQQKLIIASLTIVTVIVFAGLACFAVLYLQLPRTPTDSPAMAQAPSPTFVSTPEATATSLPGATPAAETIEATSTVSAATSTVSAATSTVSEATPTNTRVVQETATPTVTPTAVNCIHNIYDFDASGVVTDEDVETFIRNTIPLEHLDHCLRIRYVNQITDVRSTPAAGRFMPVVRHISVYPVAGGGLTPQDIFDTLTHEIGHNVHYNMRIDNLALANEWENLFHQNAGFVSDYARTNEFEDFAESYRAYVLEPEKLLLSSPVKYEFIRVEVFGGYDILVSCLDFELDSGVFESSQTFWEWDADSR